jgi:hypothetical protein
MISPLETLEALGTWTKRPAEMQSAQERGMTRVLHTDADARCRCSDAQRSKKRERSLLFFSY